jgi:hypothetical protein
MSDNLKAWINTQLTRLAKIKDDPSVWAQAVHFLIGYSVVLTVQYHWGHGLVAGLIWAGIATVIEAWYDPRYEGDPFFNGGLIDLTSYIAGILVALGSIYL